MDEECLHGVTHTGPLAFCVDDDFFGHGEIGRAIDKDMANTMVMLDDRHASVLHHRFDQRMAAARHDHIEIAVHPGKKAHTLAIGEGHKLDDIRREPGVFGPGGKRFGDSEVRMDRFFPAAKNAGVAGLEAQDGGIGRHIRTRFIDDPDHADGHPELGDLESVRTGPRADDFTDRIGEQGDLPHPLGHGADTIGGQPQTIDGRGVESVTRGRCEILGIGRDDLALRRLDGIGHGLQGRVLGVGRAERQGTGGPARAPAHLLDPGCQI